MLAELGRRTQNSQLLRAHRAGAPRRRSANPPNVSLDGGMIVLRSRIGIHHAGAELEPAKGDSGVKR